MTFKKLATYLSALERTSSRIEITKILADLFAKADSKEVDKICYLTLGMLAPSYRGIVFNLAERMMIQTISKAYVINVEVVNKLYKQKGDLGEVAEELCKSGGQSKKIGKTVTEIYSNLLEIAKDEGEKSVERKILSMANLLSGLDSLSARFLARIPVGKLRLGFSDKTILDALSWMETGSKEKKAVLESAYNILPDVGYLAKKTKEVGIDNAAKTVSPEIGAPMLPMLMQRLRSPSEMISKMRRVMVEPKFDGLRIQIHYKKSGFKDGKLFKTFTRNLNETSWMFPELTELGKCVKANEAIFDTEAIGMDEKQKTLASFQTTMTRRRKHDISKVAVKIPITFYVFDIMYKDGKSLVQSPYEERRKVLAKTVDENKLLRIVDFEITESPKRITELMRQELKEGMEGIVVKRADSKYIAGRTGWRWVKMKEEEGQKAKLADSLDLIVMGYYAGRGKRASFGLGGFLVGVLDKQTIKTVTKIGTGLSDEQFKELRLRLGKLEVKDKPKEYYKVAKILIPDVWVVPSLVTEIAADEITKSPLHSSGFALRFPRLVKFRDDKNWEEATTLSEIKKLSALQSN